RDARLSPRGPLRLLLASDDGAAAVWDLEPPAPGPLQLSTSDALE
ncbi:jg18908, partial [Pararge aegeria aegeria]